LITNKNYEKVTFDGVSLSVYELKKLVLEKKFRKHVERPGSTTQPAQSTKKSSEVDLEVRCVDTLEIYQKDTDLIPKNSRVQINRVVRNPGPAITGGTITHTHKENEHIADLRLKQQHKLQQQELTKSHSEPETTIKTEPALTTTTTKSPNTSIYDSIDENSNSMPPILVSTLPPVELLCPFDDTDNTNNNNKRHLMKNAVIAPCCGYFICCEECIRDKLNKFNLVECPRDDCLQEITVHHRLTPYNPIRQRIKDFLLSSTTKQVSFDAGLFKLSVAAASKQAVAVAATTEPVAVVRPASFNILVKYNSKRAKMLQSKPSDSVKSSLEPVELETSSPPTIIVNAAPATANYQIIE
jgi:hypothetical protein